MKPFTSFYNSREFNALRIVFITFIVSYNLFFFLELIQNKGIIKLLLTDSFAGVIIPLILGCYLFLDVHLNIDYIFKQWKKRKSFLFRGLVIVLIVFYWIAITVLGLNTTMNLIF